MPDKDPSSSSMAQQIKKKRVDDPSLSTDAGQRPVQLQRRRVWRACESCRRKKIKCDGVEPVCSQCAGARVQCTWLQTKDRAALSRHYVQELEARLMHMEEVFKQVAPIVEVIGKSPNGVPLENIVEVVQKQKDVAPLRPPQQQHQQQQQTNPLTFRDRTASEQSNSPSPRSPSAKSSREEDEVSESFGQLALDEHGHLRWIGGSSTMTLIQSFRTLTTSPLHRISPMEEDPHSPAPSANKLYFPASVYFGKVRALPGPEEVEYPARDLADKLVDAYFSRLHFLLPAIDKPSFLSSYKNLMDHTDDVALIRDQTPFVALVFAVFACAARIVDDDRLYDHDDGGLGMVYYERALILHYISHASIQITHVQCFVLLSSFLCAVNCLPQAWLLVGQAVRMSQDLGLHRFSRHLQINLVDRQVRRKVFWCVYSLDRMLALALGRPLGIEDSDCDAEYPVEIDDDDLPEYFSGAPMQAGQPALMAGFTALVDLYKIAGRVCRQIYGIDKCKDNLETEKMRELAEQAAELDAELTDWCNQLPTTFKSNPTTEAQVTMGAVLCSHYYSILTTLHRNFLPIAPNPHLGATASLKAVHTARACIRLAPSVKNVVPSSHHLAFFIQHLFSSAVIILLYAMHISDKESARSAMAEAESCFDVITSWEGIWPGARKCKELLQDLANTAREAISRGPPMHTPRADDGSPYTADLSSPRSPSRSSHLQRSLSGKVTKKTSRAKSRDTRDRHRSPSARRSRSVAATTGLSRRATSQKRPLDDFEQTEASGSGSGRPSSGYNSFAAVYSMNDQKPVIVENQQPTYLGNNGSAPISYINDSPVFGPALPPSQQPQHQSQIDQSSLNYGFPQTDSSMNWTASDSAYSQGTEFTNALGYGHTTPSTIDPSFMAYGSSVGSLMNLQAQGDSPPLSAFPVQGLPFPGLDYIRNYTPGMDDSQDGVWPSFDGGEFLYDPGLQFTFTDQPNDNTNGHQ